MILLTKRNVTTELLEGIGCGCSFLLQTPSGVRKVKLERTINSHGKYKGDAGMTVLCSQGMYVVFGDSVDIILHGRIDELVEYIKNDNYVVV